MPNNASSRRGGPAWRCKDLLTNTRSTDTNTPREAWNGLGESGIHLAAGSTEHMYGDYTNNKSPIADVE